MIPTNAQHLPSSHHHHNIPTSNNISHISHHYPTNFPSIFHSKNISAHFHEISHLKSQPQSHKPSPQWSPHKFKCSIIYSVVILHSTRHLTKNHPNLHHCSQRTHFPFKFRNPSFKCFECLYSTIP